MTQDAVRAPTTHHGPPLASESGIGALTLGGLLREVAAAWPAREALCYSAGTGPVVRWSYADLEREALRVAATLLADGLARGTRVGVLMGNRPEWLAAVFGTALAGGVGVALNTFSSRAELEHQLRHSDVSVLLMQSRLARRDFLEDLLAICPDVASAGRGDLRTPRLPFLRRVVCIEAQSSGGALESWQDFLARAGATPDALLDACSAAVKPADPALVFYSSGSTAEPKGIVHGHRAAALQCWRFGRYFGLDGSERFWSPNAFFWSGNFCMVLGATLTTGGCLVLQETFEPGTALQLLEAERVTTTHAWPHQLAELEANPAWEKVDLSALRHVEPRSALVRHPTVKGDPDWHEGDAYGLSETFTIIAGHPSSAPIADRDASTGRLFPGTAMRIVDPGTGAAVPDGETGEIALKGPTIMLGYIGSLPEDYLDPDGFFRTGDAGFFDPDGCLHWEGRINDIIKTGGANVSPVEVESVLRECVELKTAHVVGVPHETLGELVVACVVAHDRGEVDEDTLRGFARERLASYKVPRRVLFFEPDELEFTASAKVRLVALRELAAERLAAEA